MNEWNRRIGMILTGIKQGLACLFVYCYITRFYFYSLFHETPVLFRNAISKEVIDSFPNLEAFAKQYGSSIRSEVEAKGFARNFDGKLVDQDADWIGLRKETFAEAIFDTITKSNEEDSKYGSLRTIFFAGENDFTRKYFDLKNKTTANSFYDMIPNYRIQAFDGFSVWMRSITNRKRNNAVGYHAHPDAGIYFQLLGKKTFYYIDEKDWKALENNQFDLHFPLVFGDEDEIATKLNSSLKIHKIELNPGDVLFQPAWKMHMLDYSKTSSHGSREEFLSLRFGFVGIFSGILKEPWLFFRCIPMYLDVGLKVIAGAIF